MDPRKIKSISVGEKINHTGDLTIAGDVHESAEINIKDGSLIILGNIKNGAKINLSVSEELRNLIMGNSAVTNISGISGISVGLGNMVFSGRGSFTQANVSMSMGNKRILMGNVNINGRIHTDDQVEELGGGQYKITPASYGIGRSIGVVRINGVKQVPHTVDGYATATIDGRIYQSRELLIDRNYSVLVDGKSPLNTSSLSESTSNFNKSKEIPKLIIHGNLSDDVNIQSDADIEIKGIIHHSCEVNSKYGKITAHTILSDSHLEASQGIVADDVSLSVHLTSNMGNITVKNVADNVVMVGRDGVTIQENAADNCTINSSMGSLHANNLGEKATISVRDGVHMSALGAGSNVSVSMGSVHGDLVARDTRIKARDGVKLQNTGDNVRIEVSMGDAKVESQLGQGSFIHARDKVSVGHAGHNSQLICTMGQISLGSGGDGVILSGRGGVSVQNSIGKNTSVTVFMDKFSAQSIGANSSINARDGVRISEVGEHSVISVSMDKATVGNLGSHVNINARDGIIVKGRCPKSAILTSAMGKVKRHQPVYDDLAEKTRATAQPQSFFAKNNGSIDEAEEKRRIFWETQIWPNLERLRPEFKSMIDSLSKSSGQSPYDVWKVMVEGVDNKSTDTMNFKHS